MDRVAILLANGMAQRGIRSELWLTKSDGPLAGLIAPEVIVRYVPSVPFGSRGLQLFAQIPALAKMIRQHRPAAILSAGNQSNLTLALARNLSGALEVKIIQKITNPVVRPLMGKLRGSLRMRRFSRTSRMGDAVLTLSEADARDLRRSMPEAADKFHAVRNAYVTEAMLERGSVAKVRKEDAPLQLLSVGRLAYQKDQETMLRAVALLTDVDWHLRLLGNGPLRGELESLASQLAIEDRVTFEGFVADAGPAYQQSDLLVLSSRWEGFPAVPLEAMASGCGVVATDCSPGLTEILAEMGKRTTPIGDAGALAQGIRNARDGHDAAGNMREIAERYSLSSSVDDHLRLVTEVCNRR